MGPLRSLFRGGPAGCFDVRLWHGCILEFAKAVGQQLSDLHRGKLVNESKEDKAILFDRRPQQSGLGVLIPSRKGAKCMMMMMMMMVSLESGACIIIIPRRP